MSPNRYASPGIASLGGEAKQAKRMDSLRAAAAALPALDSPENAKVRLEVISTLSITGSLPGSQAAAAVRAIEVWVKAEQLRQDRDRLRTLEHEVERLERELSAARVGIR